MQVQIHQSGPHVFTATVGRKPTQGRILVGGKRQDGVFKKYICAQQKNLELIHVLVAKVIVAVVLVIVIVAALVAFVNLKK